MIYFEPIYLYPSTDCPMLAWFLIFLTFTAQATGKMHNQTPDRVWRSKKTQCEATCSHLLPEEAYNCVNACTSPKCFEEVYSQSPLEDGEIDSMRAKLFLTCLRVEVNDERVSHPFPSCSLTSPPSLLRPVLVSSSFSFATHWPLTRRHPQKRNRER